MKLWLHALDICQETKLICQQYKIHKLVEVDCTSKVTVCRTSVSGAYSASHQKLASSWLQRRDTCRHGDIWMMLTWVGATVVLVTCDIYACKYLVLYMS